MRGAWQELMTCSAESFYETWRFINSIYVTYKEEEALFNLHIDHVSPLRVNFFFFKFLPRNMCFFSPKTRVRKYCTRQTRIYMCCQWVQTAGISVVLWPYGSENSLRPVTECLGYSRVSVIYGSVSCSSDSLSSSFTQELFISWRENPPRDTNSHV